jgi:hypothetical protein
MSICAPEGDSDRCLGLVNSAHLAKLIGQVVEVVPIVIWVTRCERAHHRKELLEVDNRSLVVTIEGPAESKSSQRRAFGEQVTGRSSSRRFKKGFPRLLETAASMLAECYSH